MLAEQQNISKMKKKNILWLIAFALLMPLFALTACSDDDDDDNNDSNGDKTEQTSNDGTKVLSKKVTKIVEGDENYGHTWYFDEDGRLTSEKDTDGKSTDIITFNYSKDKIEVGESWTYLLENGRVVEWRKDQDGGKYTYSSDGYLASYICDDGDYLEEYKYIIENGNFTKIERLSTGYKYRSEESTSISYSSKLNNLNNVDLTAVLINMESLGNYFGKRSKNLPSTITKIDKETQTTYKGETTEETYSEVENFEYIYEGDYPVKILVEWTETSNDDKPHSGTRTYEIFYE